ncbi:MAG: hypothetical protein NZ899_10575 [Thermoguttaceae bacterium]|nr:hypothetical protein [Thermoguttaceae bacterium]MDW8078913.1 hypothetical protein [Thermoguttaceae bacterium]
MESDGYQERRRRRLLAERSPIARRSRRAGHKRRSAGGSSRAGSPRYPPDWWVLGQPRLLDLLPLSGFWLGGLTVLGIVLAVALPWVGHQVRLLIERGQLPQTNVFTPGGRAGVIEWLASVIMLASAQVACAILLVRRERKDDLAGLYRLWGWVALVCFVLSVEWGTGILGWAERVAYKLSGQVPAQDLALWWQVPVMLLFAILGSRLFVEYENCSLAKVALVGAGACLAGYFFLGGMRAVVGLPGESETIRQGLMLAAQVVFLLSTLFYARHISEEVSQAAKLRESGKPRRQPSSRAYANVDAPHGLAGPHGWGSSPSRRDITLGSAMSTPSLERPSSLVDSSASNVGVSSLPAVTGQLAKAPSTNGASSSGSFSTTAAAAATSGQASGLLTNSSTSATTSGTLTAGSPPASVAQNGLGQGSGVGVMTGSVGGTDSAQGVRKLTKAEKKAIRKRLEELRAAREKRLQQSQNSSLGAVPGAVAVNTAPSPTS